MEDEFLKKIKKELEWGFSEMQGSSAYSLDRNRPYDGQIQTNQGERGKQIVSGLTIRDISDCIVLGFLDCGGVNRENPIKDDIYTIDLKDVDPGAVIQNATCHIEKMMKIYPNIPPATLSDESEEE